ncbi:Mucin-20 [Tupaia chinensis]|uniref:Mucin-20 n=1 Tax=Tupaia chinensis TaxID=246437 RepID=L9JKD0_TUPCH|nr:Mucin-20 [Tupaia chinensis]
MPSMFVDVITTSEETPATRSSSTGTRMTAVETDPGCDPAEAIFDSLCTDDSSEEARRVTTDVLTLTHTTAEAEGLSPGSSASPASSVPAITTSQVLAPDLTTPANTFTYIEVTYHSKTEIETAATIPGSSDTGHTPTGGVKGSTSETAALPQSTEAVSHDPETMNFAEALSMASTAESATPDPRVDSPPPTTGTAERETIAATATTPSGVSVIVHTNSSEETAVPSVETLSYLKVSGVVMVSTEAGSTVGRAASSAGPPGYSSAEGATRNPSPSETSTPDNITTAPLSIGRSPLPSVHPSTPNSSRDTNTTLAKTIASSQASMKPPTATPTSSWTRQTTKVTASGEEGFLLLRLSVASPEDLTDPRVAERLMHQVLGSLGLLTLQGDQ